MNKTNSHDHSQKIFYIQNIREHDEEEANISSDKNNIVGETDEQKATRRKNLQCAQWRLHA